MRQDTWPGGRQPARRHAKETLMTMMGRGIQPKPSARLRPAAGNWRVAPAQSYASFTARVAGRPVRGRLPLTGRAFITEPVEDSTAWLVAKAGQVGTGSRVLDRQLAGPGFLDAGAFPEISFRSELLAWVPAGWRAVGRLQLKGTDHELACQLDLDRDGAQIDGPPRFRVTSTWILDSRWITRLWIPGLGRHISMTCSFLLEPSG
jgi:polyisoprenoid-binding protein YceI